MTSATSTRDYYEKTASGFRSSTSDFWSSEAQELLRISSPTTLLEIGCGVGAEALMFSKYTNYFGVDLTLGFLQQTALNTNTPRLIQASVTSLPFASDSFDAFWSAATLLHIPKSKILHALQSIKRCLRPGAIGFISLKEGIGEEMIILPGQEDLPARFFSFWQADEFTDALVKAGFGVVKVSTKTTDDRQNPGVKITWLGFYVISK